MLNSDKIPPNNYIPQRDRAPVHESRHTESDGGGYSFVFYGDGPKGEKRKKKKEVPPPGPPVDVHISAEVLAKSQHDNLEGTDAPEESEEKAEIKTETSSNESIQPEANKRTGSSGGGHINITA